METGDNGKARSLLRAMFDEAIAAVSAERTIPRDLGAPARGRTVIIALGKGAAAMASVVSSRLDGPVEGLVITRHGHSGPPHPLPPGIEVVEAGHPVPDEASLDAAERALSIAGSLGPPDRLLMLISGGGSALLAAPVAGVSLADKQALTQSLLRSGATIEEINSVRKHLSRVKGGRLAVAAAPAHVTTLVISDVPGDDPSFVASGPTVADHTSLATAREILARYAIEAPPNVIAALSDPSNETPPSDALGIAGGEVRVIAVASDALAAAQKLAESEGYKVTSLGDNLQAEARHLGAGSSAR